MGRLHHSHERVHLQQRNANPIAEAEPSPFAKLLDASVVRLSSLSKRASGSEDETCTPGDKSNLCAKPSQSNNITVPVLLGVLIPLVAAIIVLVYLHRRHVKKLRREDANDPHKSLDFGMDPASQDPNRRKKGKSGGNGEPEMAVTDPGIPRRPRGMSMDIDIGSAYVLPAGVAGSRESLHSMSRTMQSADDKYRPATTFIPNDTSSMHSYPTRRTADDSSSYTGSGSTGRGRNDSMNQNLLGNAQRMSRSVPPISRNTPPRIESNQPQLPQPGGPVEVPSKAHEERLVASGSIEPRDSYMSSNGADLRRSNNYLGPLIHSREPSADLLSSNQSQTQKSPPSNALPASPQPVSHKSTPPVTSPAAAAVRPPRKASLKAASHSSQELNLFDDASDYGDPFKVTPPSPKASRSRQPSVATRQPEQPLPPVKESHVEGLAEPGLGFDPRRLSMGFRPLPPDDPTDNPEQRANRIRSFYKEYFDDSKPGPAPAATGQYYEDYDQSYLDDGAIFDPTSGQFVRTEPYGRGAMTPPPRAPPRFQGAPRHHASMSGNRIIPPGPRAFSSASGQLGPPARGAPRKAAPPPPPLRVLPSPHLLKEDSFALPIDFAPPSGYKDRAAGRPDSPRGGSRPFSPMVPAHLPLVSSFDDLSVMPSPHLLRKSGTFTALDFAPPPRFPASATASDAGSIRSNRSAMSARQLDSVRAGAYRVSRIPKEVVGTRQDLNDSLKPQWNMNR